jgi:hypothetical protein
MAAAVAAAAMTAIDIMLCTRIFCQAVNEALLRKRCLTSQLGDQAVRWRFASIDCIAVSNSIQSESLLLSGFLSWCCGALVEVAISHLHVDQQCVYADRKKLQTHKHGYRM